MTEPLRNNVVCLYVYCMNCVCILWRTSIGYSGHWPNQTTRIYYSGAKNYKRVNPFAYSPRNAPNMRPVSWDWNYGYGCHKQATSLLDVQLFERSLASP
jgi:hypothetical protein